MFKKKLLPSAVMAVLVLSQMSCEKYDNDVGPKAEYGRWVVNHYQALNVGLVGSSADAATMCNYRGDGANASVYLTVVGTANATFYRDGSNTPLLNKLDGRSVRFENSVKSREEKGDVELYRQYDAFSDVGNHRIRITAGNENAVNVIPRTDFVTVAHDSTVGRTRLTMNHKREKRYIRIRTDYEAAPAQNSDGTWSRVYLTDLYQIDCGSQASSIAPNSNLQLVRTHRAVNFVGKNLQIGDQIR